MKRLILIPAFAVLAFGAEDATYWSSGELEQYAKTLPSKVEDNVALQQLGDWGSHFALMVHRSATGTSESHDNDTDFYVVQSGEATLHVGGEIVNPKATGPGEIRGTSLKGGKTMKLNPGDTVNIPPGTPHHVVLDPGQSITYLIVKIHKK